MRTLQTPRLTLRSWRLSDLGDLHGYSKNPNVGPDAGWEPHTSKAVSLAVLYSFMSKDESWAMVLRKSGRVIGSVSLSRDLKRGEVNAYNIGYHLAEEHWGQGYTTEAVEVVIRHTFEYLGAEVLSVSHYPHNHRSRRVIEKCGFVPEGTLRRAYLRYDGALLDLVCYSMLREEYEVRYGEQNPK
jgi:ribosomal-protein-alanine N-acetyltransferase